MSDRVSDIKKHNSTSSQDCHDGHDILDKIFKLQRELFRPRMKLRILNVAKYILCVSFLLCQYVASVLLLAMRALLLLAANRTASLVMTITVSPSCKSSQLGMVRSTVVVVVTVGWRNLFFSHLRDQFSCEQHGDYEIENLKICSRTFCFFLP